METPLRVQSVKGVIEVFNSDARNAMHSILGFLELLSDGPLDAAQREYVEACRATADHHSRGIEDVSILLGVAEERQIITDFAPADLFARITEVIGVIARRKGVGLSCRADSSLPPVVSGDVDSLGKALLRFAEGVVGAIDRGGLDLNLGALAVPDGFNLTLEILSRSLPLSSMRALQLDEWELDVSLSGGGALGLAAARKLANAMGGNVDACIDPSTGSRIAVTIPVGAPSGTDAIIEDGGQLAPDAQRAIRILVADDSDYSYQLFVAYLQGHPHFVARATNGVEAVELATKGSFDLVFMDIRMPIMDGYAASRRIRELETGKDRPRIPIVVLSAEDLRSQRRQGSLAGCSGFLSKPLRKEDLLEAIRAYSVAESTTPAPPIPLRIH